MIISLGRPTAWLLGLKCEDRRRCKKLVDGTPTQFSESFEIGGGEMFRHACEIGPEGIVSKVRYSRYNSGGSPMGEKDLRRPRDVGDRRLRPRLRELGPALRRRYQGDDLVYVGKVDHSSTKLRRRTSARSGADGATRRRTPSKSPTAANGVEPKLLAEIEYRAKLAAGKVRHPHFEELREEKPRYMTGLHMKSVLWSQNRAAPDYLSTIRSSRSIETTRSPTIVV